MHGHCQERLTPIATRGDEMQIPATVNADQASGHGRALYKSNFNPQVLHIIATHPSKIAKDGPPTFLVRYGKTKSKAGAPGDYRRCRCKLDSLAGFIAESQLFLKDMSPRWPGVKNCEINPQSCHSFLHHAHASRPLRHILLEKSNEVVGSRRKLARPIAHGVKLEPHLRVGKATVFDVSVLAHWQDE